MAEENTKYKKIPINQPFSYYDKDNGIISYKKILQELRPAVLPPYEYHFIPGLDEYRRKQKLKKVREYLAELKIK